MHDHEAPVDHHEVVGAGHTRHLVRVDVLKTQQRPFESVLDHLERLVRESELLGAAVDDRAVLLDEQPGLIPGGRATRRHRVDVLGEDELVEDDLRDGRELVGERVVERPLEIARGGAPLLLFRHQRNNASNVRAP